ncbi:MAG: tetratricopeptide repeat protein [bacterium]|nr:tetratricopeptide repeat protein [bacterium]
MTTQRVSRLCVFLMALLLVSAALPTLAQQGDEEREETYSILMDEAINQYFEGDYDGAIRTINEAIEVLPNQGFAYDWRGWIRYMQSDFDRALRDLNRAIELDPEDAIFYVDRGMIHAMMGNTDAALADYDQALALDPTYGIVDDPTTLDAYSIGFLIDNYTIAVETHPDDPIARAFRGALYANIGDWTAALSDFERALDAAPDFVAVRDLIEQTRALQADPGDRAAFCHVPNFEIVRREAFNTPFEGEIESSLYFRTACIQVTSAPLDVEIVMQATSGDLEPLIAIYDDALNGLYLPETLSGQSIQNTNTLTLPFTFETPGNYIILFSRFGLDEGDSTGSFTASINADVPVCKGVIADDGSCSS